MASLNICFLLLNAKVLMKNLDFMLICSLNKFSVPWQQIFSEFIGDAGGSGEICESQSVEGGAGILL